MSGRSVIALTFCIAFFAGALLTAVLIYNPEPPAPSLRQNICGLPLSELWAIIEERTGVENSTAVLDQFRIVTEGDGAVKQLSFEFYGDDKGLHRWYRVAAGPTGRVTWDSIEVDKAPLGEHPLTLFAEIERIPYRELAGEHEGLIVDVGSQWGGLAYGAGYGDLYALHQGEIIPLKSVAFNTTEPWYDIAVLRRAKDGSAEASGGSAPGQYACCCTIFTLRDLVKAETVDRPDGGLFRPPPGSPREGPGGLPGQGVVS